MSWTDRLVNYKNPHSLGSILRQRRIQPLLELVKQCHRERGDCRILDIGGTEIYWRIIDGDFLDAHNCRITIVNTHSVAQSGHPRFTHIIGNGCRMDFDDYAFDIAHSNSVIEHVGDWQNKTAFAAEIRRVSPRYFVQTPNFWFPVEPHYLAPCIHYLPLHIRAILLFRLPLGRMNRPRTMAESLQTVQGISLLTETKLRALFPDAEIVAERIRGLKKSLVAIRS